MECNSDIITCCEDDKTRITEEHLNLKAAFQKLHSVQNDIKCKVEIKCETLDQTEPDHVPCLGTGMVKDEIEIKEEPWWCSGTSTEDKKFKKEKNEASKHMLPLVSTRLPKSINPNGNCITLFDVEKDVFGKNAGQGNSMTQKISLLDCNPTSDGGHFDSVQTMDNVSTQVHKCEFCEKRYRYKSSLHRHKLAHLDTTPYKCDKCEKCFTQRLDLQRHILHHSGIKPYKCDVCDKCFTQKSYIQSHKLSHLGIAAYRCDTCEKGFTKVSDLKRHKLLHTGTKPYKCDRCDKCFTDKSNLRRHTLLHSGTKPHKCDLCGTYFTWKSNLLRHTLQHITSKP